MRIQLLFMAFITLSLASALTTENIQNIAIRVSESHEYRLGIFDCTQFSQSFNSEMDKLGIKNICVFGYYKCNGLGLHDWSEIELNGKIIRVDATGGYIIDDDTYASCYKPYFRSKRCL